MEWTVHGERQVYESEWIELVLADVEIPDGARFEHHVVRMPGPAAGTIVVDDAGTLLLWRHRFITDTWGWEIPAGRVEPGEALEDGARRECVEETGWRPDALEPIASFHPTNGLSDQTFHVFLGRGAVHVGDPVAPEESERIEWRSAADVRQALRAGTVTDGLSFAALSYALAFDLL
jgi:8-oxo-dGTP pyrophosphatase MutT (NUDIX family)